MRSLRALLLCLFAFAVTAGAAPADACGHADGAADMATDMAMHAGGAHADGDCPPDDCASDCCEGACACDAATVSAGLLPGADAAGPRHARTGHHASADAATGLTAAAEGPPPRA